MSHSSLICTHGITHLAPSPFAELAGFERQDPRKRVAATLKSGRAPPRSHAIEKEAQEMSKTFPAPLVLPHDDLNYDPDHPPQSFRSWVNEKARNQITDKRKTLYVARVPRVTDDVAWMRECTRPSVVAKNNGKPKESNTETFAQEGLESPDAELFIEYLRAFYHGMDVKEFPIPLHWVSWKEKNSIPTKTNIPKYIALARGDRSTRIRVRPSPDGIFAAQLNLDDILDAAIDMLPEDAYSIVLLVDHDIYENEEDDFCCGRAYGGSRVCVVQTARYRPSLDAVEDIDLSHMWPMSHCKHFVDSLCAVEDLAPQRPTATQIRFSNSGPIRAAITAGISPTLPKTTEEFQAQWFSRLARTVSHELGHCLGMGHCIYYACNLQGTAGMKEDVRQPPYLCPVCETKLSHAVAIELRQGSESERQTYVWERCNALREFCEKVVQGDTGPGPAMWRALSAWLADRMSLAELE